MRSRTDACSAAEGRGELGGGWSVGHAVGMDDTTDDRREALEDLVVVGEPGHGASVAERWRGGLLTCNSTSVEFTR